MEARLCAYAAPPQSLGRATAESPWRGMAGRAIGDTLQMRYTLPHFMGYRFGLFTYATRTPGGFADFDYFRIRNTLSEAP